MGLKGYILLPLITIILQHGPMDVSAQVVILKLAIAARFNVALVLMLSHFDRNGLESNNPCGYAGRSKSMQASWK